jgi:molybdopterin-guanine dinucleotide biosynthesis protein A
VRAEILGVILAGGLGLRMGGVDKAWQVYRGSPLVEHVHARLQSQVAEVRLATSRSAALAAGRGWLTIADDGPPGQGPLAAMACALRSAQLPWLAFVPCDAPGIPPDLVERLAVAGAGRPALVRWHGRRQPVFCLVPASLAQDACRAVAAGERRPDDWLRSLGAVEVPFHDADDLRNFNDLAALARAEAT